MSHIEKRLLFWSPRILCILFAIFVSLFALDAFNNGHGLWQTGLAVAIHLVPTAILVAVLIAAWRWEWIGAASFTAAAALYSARVLPQHPSWALAIAFPLVVIGGLFLANWLKRRELRATA